MKCASWCFQPGRDPFRGLLHDYENFAGGSFTALPFATCIQTIALTTLHLAILFILPSMSFAFTLDWALIVIGAWKNNQSIKLPLMILKLFLTFQGPAIPWEFFTFSLSFTVRIILFEASALSVLLPRCVQRVTVFVVTLADYCPVPHL